MTSIQLPSDATTERALEVVKTFRRTQATRPASPPPVGTRLQLLGAGPNAAVIFSNMKGMGRCREGATAPEEVGLAQARWRTVGHGHEPAAASQLRNWASSGFSMRLQDRPTGLAPS